MRLTVRWRLTLWYGAVLAAVVAGFGATVLALMQQRLLARTEFELDEEADELALEVQLAPDARQLDEQLHHRFFRHPSFDFQVSTIDGQVVFRSQRLLDCTLPPQPQEWLGGDRLETRALPQLGPCRILSRIVAGPAGTLIIQPVSPLAGNAADVDRLFWVLLASGPPAVALALGGGYFLARRALMPVEQMRAAAEEISAEQLDCRLRVANPHDELGRLAGTLNDMIGRLQRSVVEMRQFTADAAHELRTPLAVLRSEVEVALRAAASESDYRRAAEIALQQANRLSRLVDQLLVLCRHESRCDTSDWEDVRIDALLLDVAESIRGLADGKAIRLILDDLEPALVTGSDVALSQLLSNILGNAVAYVPRGGVICCRVELRRGKVAICVQDNGPGIAAVHLPRLFDRFYRVDASRNAASGGAGLGLAICRAIAQAHGGRVQVDSAVGQGTTITVVLPERQAQAGAAPGAASRAKLASALCQAPERRAH